MKNRVAPVDRPASPSSRAPALLAAALALLALTLAASGLPAGETGHLAAALLTRDLGDPRAPGNVKVVLALPGELAHRGPSVRARDFSIYVYPLGLSRENGLNDRYKAGGLYLWRSGGRIFIDSRVVPIQDHEGPAEVRVIYAPEGEPLAEGVAEGVSRYASEMADVILAIDVSSSMNYHDPRKRRVAAARTFIDMARQGGGIGRVGLVTFNSQATVDTPLVPLEQGERLLSALAGVGADGMTNLDAPLRLGMAELFSIGSRRPVIILLTDGRNEGSRYQETHLECAKAGVRIFAVGLSEQADHQLLQEMAEKTGGIYFRAPKDSDLPEIYARLAAELGKRQLLHAETLRSASGQMTLPIDATVKRLVAMADGGAKLAAAGPGGGLMTGRGMETVHMGRPAPGDWTFSWSQASPNLSILALFGDSQFFLDVFPPQLRNGRLAVGATLAQGVRALGSGRVWIEPLAGVTAERIELFDDGGHGDGQAGDGVYGALADIAESGPDRFDLTLRASGTVWDHGPFVRQTVGLTIRNRDLTPVPEELPEPEPPEEPPAPELPAPAAPIEPMPPVVPEEPIVPEPPVAIMPPEPEPAPIVPEAIPDSAHLGGDVDFGVLFPGETGTAMARVDLAAREPRNLYFDLDWEAPGEVWPELSSQAYVEPGQRSFELEMRVPETAHPGEYQGVFSISDGADLGDRASARVRVGTVRFSSPGEVDLGTVPPGTFIAVPFRVPYVADKEASVALEVGGDAGLTLTAGAATLARGRGELPLEARVAVPIGHPSGEYFGRAVLRAGPGFVEIPLRWRVAAYALRVEERTPLSGLPTPPELPAGAMTAPLSSPLVAGRSGIGAAPGTGGDLISARPGGGAASAPGGDGESPWERASRALRSQSDIPGRVPGALSPGIEFPRIDEAKKAGGDSFWSAWWVYLLAILLLILLLLLLLAYILYRLGKSALARFLLASALANLILLAIFIALLGTSLIVAERYVPPVAVNLVEDEDMPLAPSFSAAERIVLTSSSPAETATGDSASAAAAGAVGEASVALAQEGAAAMQVEKREQLPEDSAAEQELTVVTRPAAAPLENTVRDAVRRRERRTERTEAPLPSSVMLEMTEPPAESAAAAAAAAASGAMPEVGEERLDIAAEDQADRPVWSDGVRQTRSLAAEQGVLLAQAAGAEAVELDRQASRVDPRGRRRNPLESAVEFPEPRVEINDPARDAMESAAPDAAEHLVGPPGVDELRPEPRSSGLEPIGRSPGQILSPGAARLNPADLQALPRGISGDQRAEPAAARGGLRQSRGGPARAGAAQAEPEGVMPGGANTSSKTANARNATEATDVSHAANVANAANKATSVGKAAATGGRVGSDNATGSATGEARFDGSPASPALTGGGSLGRSQSTGKSQSSDAPAGSGAAPNPFPGGGTGERASFSPKSGTTGGGGGDGRDQQRRGSGRTGDGADLPGGLSQVPGGGGGGAGTTPGGGGGPGQGTATAGPGQGSGKAGGGGGGSGTGEGRFDDMADGSGLGTRQGRGGAAVGGGGGAVLSGAGGGYGLGVIPLETGDSDWRRNERRPGRRSVNVAASAVDAQSLLVVVGDFTRLPDPAAENLFAVLAGRLARGVAVEDRDLSPDNANLSDCLLAVLSPEEAGAWSEADIKAAGKYLAGGGHIWLDAASPEQIAPFMRRMAAAAGGVYGPLDAAHQLSDQEKVYSLILNGKPAAVVTFQGWRNEWRYGEARNGRTLRFLIRSLNFFLSGDAEVGIELDAGKAAAGVRVEPTAARMPDRLNGGAGRSGRVWEDFSPQAATAWRMPGWSDPGKLEAVSDGEGGRALKVDLGGAGKGRTALYRVLNPNQDFSRENRVSVDVYYDGLGEAGASMVFTVPGSSGWVDFETPPLALARGWNSLEFPLRNATFRSLAGGGGFASPLTGLERTGRVGFFLYRADPAAAVVLFRDMRLHDK